MVVTIFNPQAKLRLRLICVSILLYSIELVAILGAVEIGLQFVAPSYKNRIFDRELTGGHPIDLQPEGYRGKPVHLEKARSEFRLLALGDSVTFGTGVAADSTWPAQFSFLDAHRGCDRTSVINAAVAAASVKELCVDFEQRWNEYAPNAVVLTATNNMVSLAWIRHKEEPHGTQNNFLFPPQRLSRLDVEKERAARAVKRRLCLPSFLSENSERLLFWTGLADHRVDAREPFGPMLACGWRQGNLDPKIAEKAWTIFAEDLKQLSDSVHQSGRSFFVTYVSPRFLTFSTSRDNEKLIPKQRLTIAPAERIAEICSKLGIPYIDSVTAIRAYRSAVRAAEGRFAPMYIPFDYTHLDSEGHAAVAQAIRNRVN